MFLVLWSLIIEGNPVCLNARALPQILAEHFSDSQLMGGAAVRSLIASPNAGILRLSIGP